MGVVKNRVKLIVQEKVDNLFWKERQSQVPEKLYNCIIDKVTKFNPFLVQGAGEFSNKKESYPFLRQIKTDKLINLKENLCESCINRGTFYFRGKNTTFLLVFFSAINYYFMTV